MGFLQNHGDIILDAVLTDTGRMRLAKGDGRGLSIPNPIDTTTNQITINGDYIKRLFQFI